MSSRPEPARPRAPSFELLAGLADPARRPAAVRALAAGLGAEELVVFVPDPELGVLLPAPGFPQTLPAAGSAPRSRRPGRR
ncbi:MAG TPA: hypothetical protein VNM66_01470, partial [Thermodesulfobacteriota bacterium]|nr:hypothetical protein [Thermodesulfobacteriota bacterium]